MNQDDMDKGVGLAWDALREIFARFPITLPVGYRNLGAACDALEIAQGRIDGLDVDDICKGLARDAMLFWRVSADYAAFAALPGVGAVRERFVTVHLDVVHKFMAVISVLNQLTTRE